MNGDRGVLGVLLPLGFKTYTLKASALTGAFYCLNHANNPTNQPSIGDDFVAIPGTIERSKY